MLLFFSWPDAVVFTVHVTYNFFKNLYQEWQRQTRMEPDISAIFNAYYSFI